MKVVITGASGLLGRHVVDAVAAAGDDPIGVDIVSRDQPGQFRVADLTDLRATAAGIAGADVVVHAAAVPRPTGTPADQVWRNNALSAFNCVQAALSAGVGHFVYISSFSVFGPPFNPAPFLPAYLPIDEDHPAGPQDAYALSKQVGEVIIDAAARQGLRATSIRLPSVQTPDMFAGGIGARRGDPAYGKQNLWSYIDARDAAAAVVASIKHPPPTGHRILVAAAADTFSTTPTETLIEEAFPAVERRRPLPGYTAVLDSSRAIATIGFKARHSWREYPS
jgi:nucleoside-diphosphate-sugar epimerase